MTFRLEEQWREYRDKVYPQGIGPTQQAECRQAFYAGAASLIEELGRATAEPNGEEKAAIAFKSLLAEVQGALEERVFQMRGRQ